MIETIELLGHSMILLAMICLALALFRYMSIAITLWWVCIKANNLNPDMGIVKSRYKRFFLWKYSLLISIIANWRGIINSEGASLHGDGWKADYTGLIPRISTWEVKEGN